MELATRHQLCLIILMCIIVKRNGIIIDKKKNILDSKIANIMQNQM